MSLVVITTPDCNHCPYIKQYLKLDLKVPFTELDISLLRFAWLKIRLKQEGKGVPALMYRNQIITIGNRRLRALQALRDWGLMKEATVEELFV